MSKIKFIFILIILFGIQLSAQENVPIFDFQNQKYETSLEKYYQNRSVTRTYVNQVMEAELEAANYNIGPGDVFNLSIFGELEKHFQFTVLPEGIILIPTVGELKLCGLTLKEAKQLILKEIKKSYIKAEISVNLLALRKFRIYLTGEIEKPGTYFAQGSDRLSDVIEIALGINTWADDTRIEVIHIDRTKKVVDLSRFYRLGDKTQNPFLQGGDIIYIPSIDLTGQYVIIEGNIGFQGIYPLKKDETLFVFLRRISGINKSSNLETIILERQGKTQKIDLLNEQEKYIDFPLQSRDRIMIPTINQNVYIRGEVANPGALPYLANYRAKDYIGISGALDSAVGEEGIIIVRQETGEVLKGPDVIVEKGDTIILPKRNREIFKDFMLIIAPIVSVLIATIALVR